MLIGSQMGRSESLVYSAFSRYENGKAKPPLALIQLLKVLDRHPELLGEIRTA